MDDLIVKCSRCKEEHKRKDLIEVPVRHGFNKDEGLYIRICKVCDYKIKENYRRTRKNGLNN